MRGKVEFKKLDGDDASSASLKEKYQIHAYPTLVFTDNTGKALVNQAGAPRSAEDFKEMIQPFVR